MYKVIAILSLLLIVVKSECYTKKCKTLWATQGNENYQFFHAQTYGGDIFPNPLQFSSNREFRLYVQKHISRCIGKYCVNGRFSCPSSGNTNCYHVEHIVDANGPEFTNCPRCKDIPGNTIMAAGDWNMALGGIASKNYANSQNEKTMIYGAPIMQRAKKYIQTCCDNMIATGDSANIDCENNEGYCDCDNQSICGCDCSSDIIENGPVIDTSTRTTVGITSTILTIFIIAGVIILYDKYRNRNKKDNGESVKIVSLSSTQQSDEISI
jgi:hypothetical protein